MFTNNKFLKIFALVFFTMLHSANSFAVPVFYWCCDPCTDTKIDCHTLSGWTSYANCSAACAAWMPNAIYKGSDGSSCLDSLACAGPTPTPLPTAVPIPTVYTLGPTGPIGPGPIPTGTGSPPIVIPMILLVTPTTNPYNFGSVEQNQQTAPLNIRVQNISTGNFYGCAPTFTATGNFMMTIGNCANINAGDFCDVAAITAKPSIVGMQTSGAFSFSCANSPAVTINSFSVTGTPPTSCPIEGQYKDFNNQCKCPDTYELVQTTGAGVYACRPKVPFSFYRGGSSDEYFPVCGRNRIAVNPNGSVLDISSNSVPNTSLVYNYLSTPAVSYKYAKDSGVASGDPAYLYPSTSRCSCSFQPYSVSAIKPPSAGVANSTLGSPPMAIIPGETFAVISSQNSTNKMLYSPVAIAKNDRTGSVDGRIGDIYNAGNSECACPNINEEMVAIDPAHSSTPQGAYCRSMIPDTDPNRVLVEFDPKVHDVSGASQVIDRASQPQLGGVIIPKIALPIKVDKTPTMPYTRKIWACRLGFVVDPVSRSCVFKPEAHACGPKNIYAEASAVASGITGRTPDEKFANAVNPKVDCCSAVTTKGYSNFKYDCIDNHSTAYSSFNDLWASSDQAVDGGQLNAIALKNAAGVELTGFYRNNGSKCVGYSVFGGPLIPARVNNPNHNFRSVTGQAQPAEIEYLGSGLPLPSGDGAIAYAKLHGLGRVPTTADERRECSIMVRSAITVECGSNPPVPAVPTTYTQAGSTSVGGSSTPPKTRCTSASVIKVHTQVMQLTEIVGAKTMKTYDTVSDPNKASNISVKGIIDRLSGGECPSGSVRVGDRCESH